MGKNELYQLATEGNVQKQIEYLKKQNRKLRKKMVLKYSKGCEDTHDFWDKVLSSTPGVGEKTKQKIMERAKDLAIKTVRKGEGNA